MTDINFMQHALDLARKGVGKTSPNPAVGCVIVKKGKVVGEGWHKKCGGPHAEIFALREAGKNAFGATMYVTLEPCSYQGRTPPCVDQVIASGVKRVVIAMKDPGPRVRGRSIKKMQWAGIDVQVGILEKEAKDLNRAFCKCIIKGIPLVTAKTAQTLDGKIAAANGHSKWITSAQARKYTHQQRDQFDAILVGINTVLKDNPELNPTLKSKPWTKIVLDSRLRISSNARLLKDFCTIVVATKKASAKKIKMLENKGVAVIVCPSDKNGQVNMTTLLKELAKMGITNVLIEGGAKVIGSALREKVVDRMIAVIASKIIGDQKALSSIEGLNIVNVNKAVELDIEEVRQVGGDFIFEGKVRY